MHPQTTKMPMTRPNQGVKQKAGRQSGNLGQETVDAAKALAQDVTSQAKELASNVTDELRTSAKAGVERGSDVMRGFARAMHTAAQELEFQSSTSAQRVHRAANQIESFSDSIRDRSVGELLMLLLTWPVVSPPPSLPAR